MQSRAGPTFTTVDDSPMFRSTVSELDDALERLENRCNRFVKGSKKYKEGINVLSQSQTSFADFLEEFCGGTDEESMMLGGGRMSKFVGVFRELASFNELLHTQVELILVERLQRNWLKGLIIDGKEGKRRLDRKTSEYDAARSKHLNHKYNPKVSKWRKGDDADKLHSDMISAQAGAEDARFECARKMTELESRKRYEFLEAMVSSMDAHLRFFERGHELLKNLEPYIQQGLQVVQQLKAEEIQNEEGLEAQIYNYKEEKSARGARAADVAERAPMRPGGPVQLTSGMSANIATFESFIKESEESQGSIVTPLRQGYLHKRSTNMRREWKRRYFVLDSLGVLYYYSNKDRVDKQKTRQNTVNLLTSTIKAGAEEEGLRHCFRVVSPEREYLLQAEDDLDAHEWMEAIQGVTACLLNGNVDIEALSKAQPKPSKPTHSRQGSRAGSISSLDDMSFSPMAHALSKGDSDLSAVANGMVLDAEPGRSSEVPVGLLSPQSASRLFARAASPNSPMDILRRVTGNAVCCDCGSPEPDWASLNLGNLLCIECSGIHRKKGVHISKVRSLTLDVKVWDEAVLGMMERIGNDVANEAWEAELYNDSVNADSWVWCSDEKEDFPPASEGVSALARAGSGASRARTDSDASHHSFSFTARARPPDSDAQRGSTLSPRGSQGGIPLSPRLSQPSSAREVHSSAKPRPDSSFAVKEQYITAKYVERRYAASTVPAVRGNVQTALWEAVEGGSIKEAVQAVVNGADMNACCMGQPAIELIRDTNSLAGGENSEAPTSTANLTALHFACQTGDVSLIEYLLQNGARVDKADPYGRTPLHYCILHEHPQAAKQLLKRGADKAARDVLGQNALAIAVRKGSVADEDLFLMLS
ncbi:MAG: hypothetical protein FRX49_00672 [Trebouxia sp. A1-2]|nr:MAG: hypothetical protein FRX49_00672 [Trebouxia sp. A1-2]